MKEPDLPRFIILKNGIYSTVFFKNCVYDPVNKETILDIHGMRFHYKDCKKKIYDSFLSFLIENHKSFIFTSDNFSASYEHIAYTFDFENENNKEEKKSDC